jgi:hypothetical protein
MLAAVPVEGFGIEPLALKIARSSELNKCDSDLAFRLVPFVISTVIEQIQLSMVLDLRPGELRTMCGSRTGEWSLPCVMSD